jgi:cytoskeletal protein CcmA (bactofilin family)
MFAKPASPQTQANPESLRRAIAASLIGENVHLVGEVATEGDVQLDGRLRGDVRVGHLSLGQTGSVEGAVEAETVEIRGRVRGAITARSVRLHATADVEGDITHVELSIEAGARFVGRSLRSDDAVPSLGVTPELTFRSGLHRRSAGGADLLGEGRAHEGVEVPVEHALGV